MLAAGNLLDSHKLGSLFLIFQSMCVLVFSTTLLSSSSDVMTTFSKSSLRRCRWRRCWTDSSSYPRLKQMQEETEWMRE
jgi:hypothetical protein